MQEPSIGANFKGRGMLLKVGGPYPFSLKGGNFLSWKSGNIWRAKLMTGWGVQMEIFQSFF